MTLYYASYIYKDENPDVTRWSTMTSQFPRISSLKHSIEQSLAHKDRQPQSVVVMVRGKRDKDYDKVHAYYKLVDGKLLLDKNMDEIGTCWLYGSKI